MNMQQICDAEVALNRIANAMRNVQSGFTDDLDVLQRVIQEVRHFVVSWDDINGLQWNRELGAKEAGDMRQASVDRLVITLTSEI